MTSPADILDAVQRGDRMITDRDLAALFDVTVKTIWDRVKRHDLPQPLASRPMRWSPQQIARFLEDGAA